MFHKTFLTLTKIEEKQKKKEILPQNIFVETDICNEDFAEQVLSLKKQEYNVISVRTKSIRCTKKKEIKFKGGLFFPKNFEKLIRNIKQFILVVGKEGYNSESLKRYKKSIETIYNFHEARNILLEIEFNLFDDHKTNKDIFNTLISHPLDKITFIFSQKQISDTSLITQVNDFMDTCIENFIWLHTQNLPYCANPHNPEHVKEIFMLPQKGKLKDECKQCVMQDLCTTMFNLPQTFKPTALKSMKNIEDIKKLRENTIKNAQHHTY